MFSIPKQWALGTVHGLRSQHLKQYLGEFVWRWNQRRHLAAAFDSVLGLGARLAPATARDFIDQRV